MTEISIRRDSCRRIATFVSSLALTVGVSTTASAAHHFVSSSGAWKMPDLEGKTYTDLQTAVNSVKTGDTVWLQDGFVCNTTPTYSSGSNGGLARIKMWNVAFTLRSESGYVNEATGKGATIRGEKDPASTYPDGRGDNAVRPLISQNAGTIIQGLVLEGGVTGESFLYGQGGAVYGPATITNCVIRNCRAYCGGGICKSECSVYNSVFTNCSSFGTAYGGGAVFGGASCYGCQFLDCWTTNHNGGAVYCNNEVTDYKTIYSNCVFTGNRALSAGVVHLTKDNVNTWRFRFVDCQFLNNKAVDLKGGMGGVLTGAATLTRCMLANNQALGANGNTGGGAIHTSDTWTEGNLPVLIDCVVSNNYSVVVGGGLRHAVATNCLIIGNWSCRDGGGAYLSQLVDCRLIGNSASNILTSSNSDNCNGGDCAFSTATRCQFVGNKVWAQNLISGGSGGAAASSDLYNCVLSNNWALYRGAAVYNVYAEKSDSRAARPYACYNCLIVDNVSAGTTGGYNRGMIIEGESGNTLATNPSEFYNCTIVGNSTPKFAIINDVKLYNCIVWDNTAPGGEFFNAGTAKSPNYQVWAQYTCQKDLAEGVDGNVNAAPCLLSDYHLRKRKPCVDAALAYDWMTDAADVRSRDLDGNPRIFDRAPDMGAFERKLQGLRVYVQ